MHRALITTEFYFPADILYGFGWGVDDLPLDFDELLIAHPRVSTEPAAWHLPESLRRYSHNLPDNAVVCFTVSEPNAAWASTQAIALLVRYSPKFMDQSLNFSDEGIKFLNGNRVRAVAKVIQGQMDAAGQKEKEKGNQTGSKKGKEKEEEKKVGRIMRAACLGEHPLRSETPDLVADSGPGLAPDCEFSMVVADVTGSMTNWSGNHKCAPVGHPVKERPLSKMKYTDEVVSFGQLPTFWQQRLLHETIFKDAHAYKDCVGTRAEELALWGGITGGGGGDSSIGGESVGRGGSSSTDDVAGSSKERPKASLRQPVDLMKAYDGSGSGGESVGGTTSSNKCGPVGHDGKSSSPNAIGSSSRNVIVRKTPDTVSGSAKQRVPKRLRLPADIGNSSSKKVGSSSINSTRPAKRGISAGDPFIIESSDEEDA